MNNRITIDDNYDNLIITDLNKMRKISNISKKSIKVLDYLIFNTKKTFTFLKQAFV